MKRIYFIYGGLVGWDGYITSAGIATLTKQLAKYGPVKTYMQSALNQCAADIYSECAKDDICALGGYSGGGIQALRVAVMLGKKKIPQDINLFINMDTSPQYNLNKPDTIPRDNVKRILNIYNPNAKWPGGGYVAGKNIPHKDYKFTIGHMSFQFNQDIRDIIDREIGKL